jgi:hypothetical protein
MNATGLPVPDDAVAALGSTRNPPVVATLSPGTSAEYSYRGTVATREGSFIISLSAAHRTATGLAGGDAVEVTLRPDDAPRVMVVPDDLAAVLAESGLGEAFAALSYSRQKAFIEPITTAKAETTRAARVAKVIAALEAH